MGDEHFTQPRELRDEMAMAALVSIGTWAPEPTAGRPHQDLTWGNAMADRAEWAYRQADAMMEARKRR